MNVAIDELKSRVNELEQPRPGTRPCCIRCGESMAHPTLLISDAAQAYEELDDTNIRECVSSLCRDAARASGRTSVAASTSRKVEVCFGGDAGYHHHGRIVVLI
eukprot:8011245-Pyramimonas_sp.AAC.1